MKLIKLNTSNQQGEFTGNIFIFIHDICHISKKKVNEDEVSLSMVHLRNGKHYLVLNDIDLLVDEINSLR